MMRKFGSNKSLKKIKKINASKTYIPFSKFAERAKRSRMRLDNSTHDANLFTILAPGNFIYLVLTVDDKLSLQ